MYFANPLTAGILIKRYQRFLVDIRLANDDIITAHCPNTGRMLTCSAPGSMVYLSRSDKPDRKYPFTLEMIKVAETWVGVNTARTNQLVKEAIENGQISEFKKIERVQTEIKISPHTRLDLMVLHNTTRTYVEVKNCSLAIDGCAMFPDAVTARGTKHLNELALLAKKGFQAVIFFLVVRMDATRFAPAVHIDPEYANALEQAIAAGVQILVYQTKLDPNGIHIAGSLPLSAGFAS